MTNPSIGTVRLLINDTGRDELQIFTDTEILNFLAMEADDIKLAAAQALDTIASNEVLVAKVIRTADGLQTDGAKVSDALMKRAAALRAQVVDADESDGFFVDIVEFDDCYGPELTDWRRC